MKLMREVVRPGKRLEFQRILLCNKLRFTWGWAEVLSMDHIVQILSCVACTKVFSRSLLCVWLGGRGLCTVWKLCWHLSDIELTLWSESSISIKCQWKYFNRYSLIFKWIISEIIFQWYSIDFFILFFHPIPNFQWIFIETSTNNNLSFNEYFNFNLLSIEISIIK